MKNREKMGKDILKQMKNSGKIEKDFLKIIYSARTVGEFWEMFIEKFGIDKALDFQNFLKRTLYHMEKERYHTDDLNFDKKNSAC